MEGGGRVIGNVIKDFCMCQTFIIGVVILTAFYLILGKVHKNSVKIRVSYMQNSGSYAVKM